MSNDIKRYLSGEMTAAERHALERKALSDPFLADALEGATQLSSSQFASDIESLKTRISKKTTNTRVITINIWKWTAGIAAGLLLICVSFFIIWEITNTPHTSKQLALEEHTSEPSPEEAGVTDSVISLMADQAETKNEPTLKQALPSWFSSPKQTSAKSLALAEGKTESSTSTDDVLEETKSKTAIAELDATDGLPESEEISREARSDRDEVAGNKPDKKEANSGDKRKIARPSETPFQNRTNNIIQGKVTSAEDGSGLAGINVQIRGTTTGTVTDAQGNYQIQSAAPASVLEYSSIGLESQEVNTEQRSEVNVQMPSAPAQLSEVVVTGYALQDESPKSTVDLAHPQIGNRNYKKYLSTTMRYPQVAREQKAEGNVVVEFFVEPDGSLTDFFTVQSVGWGCDEELIRLLKEGPEWIATRKDSVPVRDKVQVQLKFALPKK